MTTHDDAAPAKLDQLSANLKRVEELTQRLLGVMSQHKPMRPSLTGPNQDVWSDALTSYWAKTAADPATIFQQQMEFWGKSVKHFVEAQQLLAQGKFEPPQDDMEEDRRFSHPLWKSNPYFNFVKQQYQMNAEAIRASVANVEGLDEIQTRRVQYFADQIVAMMSPTNFLGTNPEALEKAVETEGQSLVDGLENLIRDLEANEGELIVTLADEEAFEIGTNIATAEGSVVFRNEMLELLQFTPTTKDVHAIPIVIFPPWINKYYILDLKEKNSMIRWLVGQGYTVFVASWMNPDRSHAQIGLEDYIEEGYLRAIEVVKEITEQKQVNAVGYCIAGTTLHLALSLMKKRGDRSVKSATFFTSLIDFADQGEFTPFLQNDFIDGIERECETEGILRSMITQRTFSFLRSNDLIYGPAIKSYMMGEAPPAFDLLYWNGDGSGLPGKMAVQYLRGLCQRNEFVGDGFTLFGEVLSVKDVTIPTISITCETDHIAAWKDCYRGYQKTKSRSRSFIVSQSGHIAGIVNPPSKKKYGHYTNADLSGSADEWMENASFSDGSWWPTWDKWLAPKSGKKLPARVPGAGKYPVICAAPGEYVKKKALK